MLIQPRSQHRPAELGYLPFEALPHLASPYIPILSLTHESACMMAVAPRVTTGFDAITAQYADIFRQADKAPVAPAKAPDDIDDALRSRDIKGFGYFMDADYVGICQFREQPESAVRSAVVVAVATPRVPEPESDAHHWLEGDTRGIAYMRASQIGAILTAYIHRLGYDASLQASDEAHAARATTLARAAGLLMQQRGDYSHPLLGHDFVFVVIDSDYPLAPDRPLTIAPSGLFHLHHWWGIQGARSGRELRRRRRRRSDLSQYPMETVRRVARPTTLILDQEVPRVPKRSAFFDRALRGEMGEKAQRERGRFAFKHPTATAMMPLIGASVPFQDGEVNPDGPMPADPDRNASALKSLSYALGADLTGICQIPEYAWFSHREDGSVIEPRHRYAVVMLIDQGYDTMEGASGDDWISGSQSMRGYLRGGEIAGVMAAHIRDLGYSARSHTNSDSDLAQIPLVLLAGLGELSRIGELVLNPFVGPRFKSVVLSTDMPVTADLPIDFGLQAFCRHCLKCARECPCDAISWGEPVMFNGYEMYKPDVERCTRYRLTNARGAACGRCMKTCPINKIVDADGGLLTRIGSWLGINAPFLKRWMVPFAAWFDDWVGNGKRIAAKKWWLDLEMVEGCAVSVKGTNQRDIEPDKPRSREQPIAYYHADMNPLPDPAQVEPVDRKAALKAAEKLETPAQARARVTRGGARPAHYIARG